MLKAGDAAPEFEAIDYRKDRVSLAGLRGQTAVIEFLRYVGCPVCSVRLQELNGLDEKLVAKGVKFIAVIQSDPALIARYAAKRPIRYSLIPDKEERLYRLFQVPRGSVAGIVHPAVIRAATASVLKGHGHGKFEGNELQTPADFVLAPDGTVAFAHYGRHVADNLPVEEILARV